MAATVLAAMPVTEPMARSDHCGYAVRMRLAAAVRSLSDRGRPWVTFVRTASTNASLSLPEKNRTSIVSSPRNSAARSRCMPSITRIVDLCTVIGGRLLASPASMRTCCSSSPARRGESAGSS